MIEKTNSERKDENNLEAKALDNAGSVHCYK